MKYETSWRPNWYGFTPLDLWLWNLKLVWNHEDIFPYHQTFAILPRKCNHTLWFIFNTSHPPPPPPPKKKKKKKTMLQMLVNEKKLTDLDILQSLWYCALRNSFFFCHSPSKTTSMIIPVIAPMNLLGLMQGHWFCIFEALAVVSLALPHNMIPLRHWRGRIVSMTSATAETWAPGRQMRPMNYCATQGLTMDGPVRLATNAFLRFCRTYFRFKADRRFYRCTDIICPCGKHSPQRCNGKKNRTVFLPWFGSCLSHVTETIKPIP